MSSPPPSCSPSLPSYSLPRPLPSPSSSPFPPRPHHYSHSHPPPTSSPSLPRPPSSPSLRRPPSSPSLPHPPSSSSLPRPPSSSSPLLPHPPHSHPPSSSSPSSLSFAFSTYSPGEPHNVSSSRLLHRPSIPRSLSLPSSTLSLSSSSPPPPPCPFFTASPPSVSSSTRPPPTSSNTGTSAPVLSVSITVIEPCLDSPISPLDPLLSPFSRRRIWKLPSIRIYGVINENPQAFLTFETSSSSSSSSLPSHPRPFIPWSPNSPSSLPNFISSSSSFSSRSYLSTSSFSPSSSFSSFSSSSSSSSPVRLPEADRRFVGKTCCLVVHNVFPYFFVPVPHEAYGRIDAWLDWFSEKLKTCEEAIMQKPRPLEKNTKRGRPTPSSKPNHASSFSPSSSSSRWHPFQGPQTSSLRQTPPSSSFPPCPPLIFSLRLVKRYSFYGYDHSPRLFVQIFTLFPGSRTTELAARLLQGRVTGSPLQPFEIHIPYLIHFLADFRLRGMDLLTIQKPHFANPPILKPLHLLHAFPSSSSFLLLREYAHLRSSGRPNSHDDGSIRNEELSSTGFKSSVSLRSCPTAGRGDRRRDETLCLYDFLLEVEKQEKEEREMLVIEGKTSLPPGRRGCPMKSVGGGGGVLLSHAWRSLWLRLRREKMRGLTDVRRENDTCSYGVNSLEKKTQGDNSEKEDKQEEDEEECYASSHKEEEVDLSRQVRSSMLDARSSLSKECSRFSLRYPNNYEAEREKKNGEGGRDEEVHLFRYDREHGDTTTSTRMIRGGGHDISTLNDATSQVKVDQRTTSPSYFPAATSSSSLLPLSSSSSSFVSSSLSMSSFKSPSPPGASVTASSHLPLQGQQIQGEKRKERERSISSSSSSSSCIEPRLVLQRRTKCEVEVHANAVNILNPFFLFSEKDENEKTTAWKGEECGGDTDSPFPSRSNGVCTDEISCSCEPTRLSDRRELISPPSSSSSKKTTVKFPIGEDRLLLHSVLDFWREEARRCSMFGIDFPFASRSSVPPPSTLPPDAVAALAKRNEVPARHAVPEIFKRQFLQLLRRTGLLLGDGLDPLSLPGMKEFQREGERNGRLAQGVVPMRSSGERKRGEGGQEKEMTQGEGREGLHANSVFLDASHENLLRREQETNRPRRESLGIEDTDSGRRRRRQEGVNERERFGEFDEEDYGEKERTEEEEQKKKKPLRHFTQESLASSFSSPSSAGGSQASSLRLSQDMNEEEPPVSWHLSSSQDEEHQECFSSSLNFPSSSYSSIPSSGVSKEISSIASSSSPHSSPAISVENSLLPCQGTLGFSSCTWGSAGSMASSHVYTNRQVVSGCLSTQLIHQPENKASERKSVNALGPSVRLPSREDISEEQIGEETAEAKDLGSRPFSSSSSSSMIPGQVAIDHSRMQKSDLQERKKETSSENEMGYMSRETSSSLLCPSGSKQISSPSHLFHHPHDTIDEEELLHLSLPPSQQAPVDSSFIRRPSPVSSCIQALSQGEACKKKEMNSPNEAIEKEDGSNTLPTQGEREDVYFSSSSLHERSEAEEEVDGEMRKEEIKPLLSLVSSPSRLRTTDLEEGGTTKQDREEDEMTKRENRDRKSIHRQRMKEAEEEEEKELSSLHLDSHERAGITSSFSGELTGREELQSRSADKRKTDRETTNPRYEEEEEEEEEKEREEEEEEEEEYLERDVDLSSRRVSSESSSDTKMREGDTTCIEIFRHHGGIPTSRTQSSSAGEDTEEEEERERLERERRLTRLERDSHMTRRRGRGRARRKKRKSRRAAFLDSSSSSSSSSDYSTPDTLSPPTAGYDRTEEASSGDELSDGSSPKRHPGIVLRTKDHLDKDHPSISRDDKNLVDIHMHLHERENLPGSSPCSFQADKRDLSDTEERDFDGGGGKGPENEERVESRRKERGRSEVDTRKPDKDRESERKKRHRHLKEEVEASWLRDPSEDNKKLLTEEEITDGGITGEVERKEGKDEKKEHRRRRGEVAGNEEDQGASSSSSSSSSLSDATVVLSSQDHQDNQKDTKTDRMKEEEVDEKKEEEKREEEKRGEEEESAHEKRSREGTSAESSGRALPCSSGETGVEVADSTAEERKTIREEDSSHGFYSDGKAPSQEREREGRKTLDSELAWRSHQASDTSKVPRSEALSSMIRISAVKMKEEEEEKKKNISRQREREMLYQTRTENEEKRIGEERSFQGEMRDAISKERLKASTGGLSEGARGTQKEKEENYEKGHQRCLHLETSDFLKKDGQKTTEEESSELKRSDEKTDHSFSSSSSLLPLPLSPSRITPNQPPSRASCDPSSSSLSLPPLSTAASRQLLQLGELSPSYSRSSGYLVSSPSSSSSSSLLPLSQLEKREWVSEWTEEPPVLPFFGDPRDVPVLLLASSAPLSSSLSSASALETVTLGGRERLARSIRAQREGVTEDEQRRGMRATVLDLAKEGALEEKMTEKQKTFLQDGYFQEGRKEREDDRHAGGVGNDGCLHQDRHEGKEHSYSQASFSLVEGSQRCLSQSRRGAQEGKKREEQEEEEEVQLLLMERREALSQMMKRRRDKRRRRRKALRASQLSSEKIFSQSQGLGTQASDRSLMPSQQVGKEKLKEREDSTWREEKRKTFSEERKEEERSEGEERQTRRRRERISDVSGEEEDEDNRNKDMNDVRRRRGTKGERRSAQESCERVAMEKETSSQIASHGRLLQGMHENDSPSIIEVISADSSSFPEDERSLEKEASRHSKETNNPMKPSPVSSSSSFSSSSHSPSKEESSCLPLCSSSSSLGGLPGRHGEREVGEKPHCLRAIDRKSRHSQSRHTNSGPPADESPALVVSLSSSLDSSLISDNPTSSQRSEMEEIPPFAWLEFYRHPPSVEEAISGCPLKVQRRVERDLRHREQLERRKRKRDKRHLMGQSEKASPRSSDKRRKKEMKEEKLQLRREGEGEEAARQEYDEKKEKRRKDEEKREEEIDEGGGKNKNEREREEDPCNEREEEVAEIGEKQRRPWFEKDEEISERREDMKERGKKRFRYKDKKKKKKREGVSLKWSTRMDNVGRIIPMLVPQSQHSPQLRSEKERRRRRKGKRSRFPTKGDKREEERKCERHDEEEEEEKKNKRRRRSRTPLRGNCASRDSFLPSSKKEQMTKEDPVQESSSSSSSSSCYHITARKREEELVVHAAQQDAPTSNDRGRSTCPPPLPSLLLPREEVSSSSSSDSSTAKTREAPSRMIDPSMEKSSEVSQPSPIVPLSSCVLSPSTYTESRPLSHPLGETPLRPLPGEQHDQQEEEEEGEKPKDRQRVIEESYSPSYSVGDVEGGKTLSSSSLSSDTLSSSTHSSLTTSQGNSLSQLSLAGEVKEALRQAGPFAVEEGKGGGKGPTSSSSSSSKGKEGEETGQQDREEKMKGQRQGALAGALEMEPGLLASYGALIAVEILTERSLCSVEAIDAGVADPLHDGILAMVLLVRDERLVFACKQAKQEREKRRQKKREVVHAEKEKKGKNERAGEDRGKSQGTMTGEQEEVVDGKKKKKKKKLSEEVSMETFCKEGVADHHGRKRQSDGERRTRIDDKDREIKEKHEGMTGGSEEDEEDASDTQPWKSEKDGKDEEQQEEEDGHDESSLPPGFEKVEKKSKEETQFFKWCSPPSKEEEEENLRYFDCPIILFVDQAYKPRITLQETTSHSSSTSSSSFPGSTTPTTPTTTTRPSPSFSPSSLPSHPFSSTTPLQTSSTGPLFSPSSSFLSTNPSLSSSSSPISPSLGPPPRPSLSSAPIRSLHSSSASSTQPSKSPPFFSCSPVVSSVSTPSISQRSRQTDLPPVSSFHDFVSLWRSRHGFTKLSCQEQLKAFLPDQAEVISVESESDLLDCFSLVCGVVDPSIILHWESHTGIGYILRRARVLGCSHRLISGLSRRLDRHLLSSLSSALSSNSPLPNSSFASPLHKPRPSFSSTPSSSSSSSSSDETTSRHVSRETAKTASRPFLSEGPRRGGMFEVFSEGSSLSGRLLLECWRVLQHEVKLQQSSLEGVAKEILNVTFASVPHAVLANLWKQGQAAQRRTEIRDEAKLMTGWRLWQYRLKIDKSLEMAKERTKRKKVSNRDNGYPVGEKDCHLVEKGSGCHEGEEGEKKKREGKDTGGEEDEEKKRKKNGEGEDRGEEEEEEKKKRLGNDKDREDRDVEGRSLDEEMNKERRKKKEEKKEDAVGVVEDGGGCHQENRSLYPIVEEEKESLERPESSMTLEESYSSDKDLSEILGTTERSERSDFNTGSTEGEGTPPLHLSMKKMEDRKEVIAEQTRKITEEEEKNVKKLSREGKRLSIEGVEEGENEEKEQEEEEGEQERMMYRMRLWNLFEEVERTVEKTSLSAAETAIEKEGGAGEKESKEDEGGDVDGLWGIRTMGSVLKYLLGRVCMMVSLIDSTELIPRTSELARLYGCDFISALSRGSQFKVESVMIRATKRLNFLFVSPSQTQVTEQPANLCIPLVLEPKSGFYWSPVCVLDFQSLYPSIIIANNICYATALGSVEIDPIDQPMKTLGVMSIHVPPQVFRQISQAYRRKLQHTLPTQTPPTTTTAAASTSHSSLQAFTSSCIKEEEEEALLFSADRDHLAMKKKKMDGLSNDSNPSQLKTCLPPQASHGSLTQDSFRTSQDWSEDKSGIRVLPNGSMFVSRRVRRGIFPQVLSDILQTRIMVKQAMKKYKGKVDENLLRLLNYRQYGLKMIANVSYGYTAASFTGHMPCADIADAIVQTARTTLMRAIALVHSTPRWGGRVLYGDTDSLFVLLENKSLEAAFEIGREIAYTVTQQNPSPVELQLEKVFYPCCLVSKKRYVGNAYTSPTSPPFFDAKGIEAIRRDQCGCTSSLLESSLRIFFSTRDLSQVKSHLYRQWMKILSNRISLKEFIFYRKCRLGSYKAEFGASTAASLPAQAKVAYARMQALAQSAAVTRGSDDRESESLLLARRSGPARGERVAFVYADLGLGGNQAFLSGTKKTSLRLLDCAVSPDQVEGGGRPDDLVRIFLYGIPCMVLRPMPLQVIAEPFDCLVPREGNRGLGGEQESFGGDMTSGGGWFRRWIDKGSSRCMAVNNAYGRPASFFTTRGSSRPGMPLAGGMFEEPHRSEGLDRMRGARRTDLFSRGFFLSSSPFSNARGEEWVSPSPWQGIGGYRLKNHLALDSLHSKPALLPVYLKYYIVKQVIPAMDRLFGLLPFPTCVDLKQWYENMPKPRNTTAAWLKYYVGTDQRGSNKPAAPPAGGASRQGSGLDRWGISPSSPQRQRGGVSGTIATRHTLARHGPPSKRSSLMVQKLPAAPSPSRPLIRETEQARSSLSAAQKQQQKLLQALKIDKKSSSRGGGSGTRLHHFFATSSCILCGEKCSLLPPKALDDALLRTTSPGGGRLGPRGGRGRRRERQIEFEEEETGEDIRAMLFRKLENGSFNARKTTQKERKDIGEPVVIDLASSASSSITQAASLHLAGLGGAGTKAVLGRRGEDSQPRQPPPVCSACSANAEGIIVQMYRQLEEVERRMNEIENICETCAGSKLCAAACLNAWHCDVYFLRLRNEHRYATVASQMRALHLHVKRGR